MDKYLPNIEQIINIKKGVMSGISHPLFPLFEDFKKLDFRVKALKLIASFVKGSFYNAG